ncbi:MAG: hypothetical protein ACR2MK_09345 [Solirubrobacteraceae bacterium]
MSLGIVIAAAAVAVAVAAAGCGQAASNRSLALAAVPLTRGTRVIIHTRRCDRGANPYCAVQLVVVGRRYESSGALLGSERQYLKAHGWTVAGADTGDERAANSPGHRLRLTYATAALDLKDVDLGWVQRSRPIGLSLSRTMFNRFPALSLMLEEGSS